MRLASRRCSPSLSNCVSNRTTAARSAAKAVRNRQKSGVESHGLAHSVEAPSSRRGREQTAHGARWLMAWSAYKSLLKEMQIGSDTPRVSHRIESEPLIKLHHILIAGGYRLTHNDTCKRRLTPLCSARRPPHTNTLSTASHTWLLKHATSSSAPCVIFSAVRRRQSQSTCHP